jgi:hypothetical protein
LSPPVRPPIINTLHPRFYEIAALTTLASEFVVKTVSCSTSSPLIVS